MGFLIYDSIAIEFDDKVLAHLQVVIASKLRRRESFLMSWRDSTDTGHGRSAIWLEPSIPLFFRFDNARGPALDREWVERLVQNASTAGGLHVTDPDGNELTARANPPIVK
ncbi:ATP-dependent DNA ligase [Leifsonia sp. NPDC014704]|uniref:DUF7882 family protein n=1 Tax=Leifsonia sp. NPDC014704 TaxID=3364123 RepID=UPI0036F497AD